MPSFHSARIRLTIIYTIILALVLLLFSVIIYNLAMEEVFRSVQRVHVRMGDEYGLFLQPERVIIIDTESLNLAKKNLITRLALTNLIVLLVTSGLSYYLAGNTLHPIQNMTKLQQQFVADASHELRTPLTIMESTTEISLRDQNLTLLDAKSALQDNLEEINRLQRLTNNLLTLSQTEGRGALQLESVDIQPVIDHAIDIVLPLTKEKSINIKNDPTDARAIANVDTLIESIVILLENAIKYSPENAEIEIQTKSKNENLHISIIDHGVGITESELPNLFDRFYRAESSRTSKGFGLGLSIAKKLITMQNGQILVKSQEGLGPIFTITLSQ